MKDEADVQLVVVRCKACGDTFPFSGRADTEIECPSCGGREVEMAQEPML